MTRRSLLAALMVAVFVVVVIAVQAFNWFRQEPNEAAGVTVGGSFALAATSGGTLSDEDLRGRYLLIYFGFTYCPDVCPTELAVMARAIDLLGEDGEEIQPLLITVDPERDRVEVLRDYVAAFHPRMIGLTGTLPEIEAVAKAYRVYFAKTEPDSHGDYTVDHSTVVYLMDPEGAYLTVFGRDTDAEAMAEGIRHYMR